jgi:hypothetical protein
MYNKLTSRTSCLAPQAEDAEKLSALKRDHVYNTFLRLAFLKNIFYVTRIVTGISLN